MGQQTLHTAIRGLPIFTGMVHSDGHRARGLVVVEA
jgi:hypothetical protein